MELKTAIPLYCDKHDWQFATDWTPEGYTVQCGCVLKYRASAALTKVDYNRLKAYSQA